MKKNSRFFLITLMVAVMLSVISCHRNTPAPSVAIEAIYAETADIEQEEVHTEIVGAEQEEVQSVPVPLENAIIKFTPLGDNERFAYSVESVEIYVRDRFRTRVNNMTVYAVRDNDVDNTAELFLWEDVNQQSIQLTSDLRKVFFMPNHSYRRWTPAINLPLDIYMADGGTGEIQRVLAGTVNRENSIFRVSQDGKFVLLSEREINYHEFARVLLFLFDVENGSIINEFEWRIDFYGRNGLVQGFEVGRLDNIFRIIATTELGFITAVAELDPVAMVLQTVWFGFRDAGLPAQPNASDHDWLDDVMFQRRNPSILLRR